MKRNVFFAIVIVLVALGVLAAVKIKQFTTMIAFGKAYTTTLRQ